MTLFTLSNLYVQDLSLHGVAINRLTICLDGNDEGGTQFLKTQG